MGMGRHTRSGFFITDEAQVVAILEQELAKGTIQQYGRRRVLEYLRQRGILVARYLFFSSN